MSRHILTYLVVLFVLYTQISTGLIIILEDISYTDSLYYCCTTLTTVGFGDSVQENILNENNTLLQSVGLALFLFFWLFFGLVLVVANLLMIFSAKLSSRDVVTMRYIKNIRRDGDKIKIDTDVDGKAIRRFTIMRGPETETRKNLRYLFTM